jgi:membrane protease subunit HflK
MRQDFMPWSNQGGGGGGWKSGGGPWGQGPSGGGGGGNQPDIEELLKRSQDRLKQVMPGGSGLSGSAIGLIILAALAIWGASGFYTVKTNEVALNLVFGKFVGRTGEGLNYNWPYPIGSVVKLPVTDVKTIELGTAPVDLRRSAANQVSDSLNLTADENIVDIGYSVQWRISPQRPEDFVFNIQNPEGSIRAVAESAMREVIGKRPLRNVLPSEIPPVQTQPGVAPAATPSAAAAAAASSQSEILDEVRRVMQVNLDQYGAGVVIDRVIMTRIGPPPEVLAAFTDVQAAVQDRDRLQNEAQTHASKVVPEAKGQAEKITLEAEAYQKRTISEAQGAAARFRQVYEEYRKAPDVTRERMFLETMERIMGSTDKIIIDKSPGGSGVVPYLPLNELSRRSGAQTKQ